MISNKRNMNLKPQTVFEMKDRLSLVFWPHLLSPQPSTLTINSTTIDLLVTQKVKQIIS